MGSPLDWFPQKWTSAWSGLLAAFPHGIYPTSLTYYLVPCLVIVVLVASL